MRIVIIGLMGIGAGAAAQTAPTEPPHPAQGPGPVIMRREVPPPARSGDRAELPLQMVSGFPTINLTVNGHGPYRMIVDTGAMGYLRLRPEVATALGLAPVGEAMAADPSGKNPVRIKLYNVDSVKIGDVTYSGVSTSAIGMPNLSWGGVDGVVGIGFFRDLLLTLDYGKGQMKLAAGALPPANGQDIVTVEAQPSGLLVVPLTVGSRTIQAHLDTGNSRQAVFLPEADAKAVAPNAKAKSLGVARTVSQEIPIFALEPSAPVRIGSVVLPVHEVAYPAVREANVGSGAFTGMSLTIDWKNRRLRVKPSKSSPGERA